MSIISFQRSFVKVDVVCHGKTPIMPCEDGSDPYAVSTPWYYVHFLWHIS